MNASQHQQVTTRMFARVLGPFLLIVTVTAVLRGPQMRELLSTFAANALWAWVVGAFILLFGLVIIAMHQYWRGAAAIIVSLLGWFVALRGFFLLAFPQVFMSMANTAIDATAWWRSGFVIMALVGLYLTYAGWVAAPNRPEPKAAPSAPDLPHAA